MRWFKDFVIAQKLRIKTEQELDYRLAREREARAWEAWLLIGNTSDPTWETWRTAERELRIADEAHIAAILNRIRGGA